MVIKPSLLHHAKGHDRRGVITGGARGFRAKGRGQFRIAEAPLWNALVRRGLDVIDALVYLILGLAGDGIEEPRVHISNHLGLGYLITLLLLANLASIDLRKPLNSLHSTGILASDFFITKSLYLANIVHDAVSRVVESGLSVERRISDSTYPGGPESPEDPSPAKHFLLARLR